MKTKFNPNTDIPDLSDKVIFITGGSAFSLWSKSKMSTISPMSSNHAGTAGLGKESICTLAKHSPEHIYFSGRDSAKAAAVIDEVRATTPNAKLTFIECDLASLPSIEKAAQKFLGESQRLDILMCNAGVMALPPGLTHDEYEVQFGINHMGHAFLVALFLPTLLRTAEELGSDVRVVFLTSLGYGLHPKGGIEFASLRTTQKNIGPAGTWRRYGQSKLANILYAAELARRYPSITAVSVHPGVIATGLVGNLSFMNKALVYLTNVGRMTTPAEGSWNQLWAATSEKKNIVNGAFYEPVGALGRHDKESQSSTLAAELWEWTETELKRFQAQESSS